MHQLGMPLFQPGREVLALKDVYFPFPEVIPRMPLFLRMRSSRSHFIAYKGMTPA